MRHESDHAANVKTAKMPSEMVSRDDATARLWRILELYTADDDLMEFVVSMIMVDEISLDAVPSHSGGSVVGRRFIWRDREGNAAKLYRDYFSHDPRYNARLFRRRFRMRRQLFLRIVDGLKKNGQTFITKTDCTGRKGFDPIQKATIAMRLLAYNMAADSLDEGMEVGESTALLFFKRFCIEIVQVFGSEYLRELDGEELKLVVEDNARRGWPGLIGSLDCMHWRWLMCPVAWKGSYTGKEDGATLVLEAVCDRKLRVYHYNFGRPGANNDLNILAKSTLLDDILSGKGPQISFTVNYTQLIQFVHTILYLNNHCSVFTGQRQPLRRILFPHRQHISTMAHIHAHVQRG